MATSGTVGQTHTAGFYTYAHVRKDTNAIFYIGKGCGKRAHSREVRNVHWKNVVNKHGMDSVILAYWQTEGEAFEHEKFLLMCFKDMGLSLANKTLGGEGTVGWIPSEENRNNIGNASKRRWDDLDFKRSTSEKIKQSQTPEVKATRAASMAKVYENPEALARCRALGKSLWEDPEYRTKVLKSRSVETVEAKTDRIAKSTQAMRSEENRAKSSANSLARWADPEFQAMMHERNMASQSPKRAEAQSLKMKALWKDPEYLAKMAKRAKRGFKK
jgi:hypothetical protein